MNIFINKLTFMTLLTVQSVGIAYAQAGQSGCGFVDSLKIRKTLDGSKNEALPAIIAYEKRDGEDNYTNIDIAVSPGAISCGNTKNDFNFYPKLEYHRSTSNQAIRKSVIGLNADYSFLTSKQIVRGKPPKLSPHFLLEASVSRDSINDKTTRKYALLLTGKSFIKGAPGGAITFSPIDGAPTGPDAFIWYPYIGIESYENLPIELDGVEIAPAVEETFLTAKVTIEIYPFRRIEKKGLQILLNHTFRKLNGESPFIDYTTEHFEASINYYFDKEGHVGFGVDYENGSSPARNFIDEERTTIGLKLSW